MGNGRVAMNGNGADIHQLLGPCYSVPGVMTLKLTDPSVKAENHRIRGSAGYITKLTDTATGAPVSELTDYSHPTEPVFIRRFNLHRPLSFALKSTFETTDTTDAFGSRAVARPFEIPDGSVVFSKSKTNKETYCQVLLSPICTAAEENITFPEGESYLIFIGGDYGTQDRESFPNCMKLSQAMLSADLDGIFDDFTP